MCLAAQFSRVTFYKANFEAADKIVFVSSDAKA